LDELNHRLKNNLQILHGLLLIALHKTDNSEAREVLSDTSRRIVLFGPRFNRYQRVETNRSCLCKC
jgi:hypothetical protein